jgi:hypothetical protein
MGIVASSGAPRQAFCHELAGVDLLNPAMGLGDRAVLEVALRSLACCEKESYFAAVANADL